MEEKEKGRRGSVTYRHIQVEGNVMHACRYAEEIPAIKHRPYSASSLL